MPDAEIITFGSGLSFIALDSAALTLTSRPSKASGFTPRASTARASASRKDVSHCKNTLVASTARGLSHVDLEARVAGDEARSFISRMKYSISCVRPTAKEGITTLPPRSSVRCMTAASSET